MIRKRLIPYINEISRMKRGQYACRLMDQVEDLLPGQDDTDGPLGTSYLTGFSSQQLSFIQYDYAVRKEMG